MAINSVSGAAPRIPQQVSPQSVNHQQVKTSKDADGDNDGTKAGQLEKAGESGKASEVARAKPANPSVPTPPPSGNIENRQPPAHSQRVRLALLY
jgi:hypothetical protein